MIEVLVAVVLVVWGCGLALFLFLKAGEWVLAWWEKHR